MELRKQLHAKRGGTEIIPFSPVFPFRFKKSSNKGRTKIVSSRFSPRPASHINSPEKFGDFSTYFFT